MYNNYVHFIGKEDHAQISEIFVLINLVFDEHPELKELVREELLGVDIHSWEGFKQ